MTLVKSSSICVILFRHRTYLMFLISFKKFLEKNFGDDDWPIIQHLLEAEHKYKITQTNS